MLVVLFALLPACGGGDYDGNDEATPIESAPGSGSDSESSTRGRSIYVAQCQVCHGSSGNGSAAGPSLIDCPSCSSTNSLSTLISNTMPTGNSQQCEGQCAVDVSNYILTAFNDGTPDDEPPSEEPPDPEPPEPPSGGGINVDGQSAYTNQCASCHGSNGTGTPQGPSLIACGSCQSLAVLSERIANTMPLGNSAQCTGDCAGNIAEYILQAFNDQVIGDAAQLLDEILLSDLKTTLRKASLNLAGRLPVANELSDLEFRGEEAFDEILGNIMRESAFYARMMEIWNDFLLQNKYLGGENAISLLRNNDFPQRRWFDELGLNRDDPGEERDLYFWLREQANDAMAQEALRLITYILKNDRPITEMLTGNFIVANYYSARSYGVEGQRSWKTLSNPTFPDYPYDPEDFQPIRLYDPQYGAFPHAGVMTSIMFLNRFPTTPTNRNRHRSRITYKLFLDTDVLLLDGTRPVDAEDINSPNPVLDNPNCSICHSVVDPVASIYQNWSDLGQFRPTSQTGGWHTDMEQRGFKGEPMPLAGNADSSVRWLAEQIVADPRFTKSLVKTLYTGITGQAPIPVPEADVPEDAPQRRAYLAQDAYFQQLANNLATEGNSAAGTNYNLRNTIRAIVKGPYFRATSLQSGADTAAHAYSGSDRLLTPEMLHRKLVATLGLPWQRSNRDRLLDLTGNGLHILYGGMDSDSIITRITEPNGLIASTQKRMASQMACEAVARDFFLFPNERALFPYMHPDDSLLDNNGNIDPDVNTLVISNLQHLHWALLGVDARADDPEILELRNLMAAIQARGLELIDEGGHYLRGRLHFACDLTNDPETGEALPDEERIVEDANYMLRTWQALLVYYLSDYRFVYE